MAKKFNLAEYVKAEPVSDSDQITMIPWTHIRANVRNFYEVADVADLADSIQLNGLMDPLVVYKGDGILYTILSGHRRYRAITELRQREGCEHLYDEIPCMVRAKPSSTAMEDILLIQANSTGRIRTPKDMATEAERLTAALVKLKKDGAELPGRMRDIVADAMGVSSSKLARMTAIKNNLRVPGFRGAYDRQELSEAAAYEISQMNEADQYHMLDRAIDAGLDYETLDIKSVQKLRRQIEAGESTKQDLAAAAEKLGISCPEGDYSPLLAALVAEALPASWRKGLRSCRTKAEGLEHLHRFGFGHHSSSGGGVCYDSDPQALTLRKPICRRIKWADVWELLALDAMQRQAVEAPAEDEKKPALVKLKKDAGPVPEWLTGEPTREGRYICLAEVGGAENEFTSCEWIDGGWWVFDRPALPGFDVSAWWPLPDKEE